MSYAIVLHKSKKNPPLKVGLLSSVVSSLKIYDISAVVSFPNAFIGNLLRKNMDSR